MIRVLIVDDSAFYRNILQRTLSADPEIEVAGLAKNGVEALEMIRSLQPDLVTMDVEMPKLDGISTLKIIMAEMPCPVIMVSSLTQEGAVATLAALDAGAVDFVPKYSQESNKLDLVALGADLCSRIHAVVQRSKRNPFRGHPITKNPLLRTQKNGESRLSTTNTTTANKTKRDFIAIGVSTGGPPVVRSILSALPASFPGCVLIAQHMPASCTGPFAERLNSVSQLTVKEAETGAPLKAGFAYVAPGGKHIRVDLRGATPYLKVVDEPSNALYKPSVNVLMESIGQSIGSRTVGVMLTGMGNDGVKGTAVLKAKGGYMLAQDEASCVVYGMPKAVVDGGFADKVVDASDMAKAIMNAMNR